MRKIGWQGQSNKITPPEAYQVVSKAMKNRPNDVKTSEIGLVFDKALQKIGVNTSQLW